MSHFKYTCGHTQETKGGKPVIPLQFKCRHCRADDVARAVDLLSDAQVRDLLIKSAADKRVEQMILAAPQSRA